MPRADFPVLTVNELREVTDLLGRLNGMSFDQIAIDAFKLHDSNGECLGWVTQTPGIDGWVFAPTTEDGV